MRSKELRPPLPDVGPERDSRCPATGGASGRHWPFGQEDRHDDLRGKAHRGLADGKRPRSRHPPTSWLRRQDLQTTEMYLCTDPAEKLGTLFEWRSPGLDKGRFAGVQDELMAMLAGV